MPEANATERRKPGRPAVGALDAFVHIKASRAFKEYVRALADSEGLTESDLFAAALASHARAIGADPPPPRGRI